MSLDVIIRRNISFVGCILIVAVTELNKILRLLFTELQWRRRCISSSISFNSHLVHIRWFTGVIGLLYRPLSIFRRVVANIHLYNSWLSYPDDRCLVCSNQRRVVCQVGRQNMVTKHAKGNWPQKQCNLNNKLSFLQGVLFKIGCVIPTD